MSRGLFAVGGSASGKIVLRSLDDGLSWTKVYSDSSGESFQWISSIDDGSLVAISDTGSIQKSTDFGASWSSVGTVPTSPFFPELTVYSSSQIIITGEATKLYRTTDLGSSWSTVHTISGGESFIKGVPQGSDLIYGVNRPTSKPIAVSHDGGATWSDTYVQNLEINNTYPAMRSNGYAFLALVVNPLYTTVAYAPRSSDFGDNWSGLTTLFSDVYTSYQNQIVYDLGNGNLVAYWDTYGENYKSTDNGASWTRITPVQPFGIHDLVVPLEDIGTSVVVTDNGASDNTLRRTTDYATSFSTVYNVSGDDPLWLTTSEIFYSEDTVEGLISLDVETEIDYVTVNPEISAGMSTPDIAVPPSDSETRDAFAYGSGDFSFPLNGVTIHVPFSDTNPSGTGFKRPHGPSIPFE